ncbi:MAG: mucoidy inhibitor MuiA family protein, partial [Bacteroidota bacterium]|nr:mucoidy inhibitor MuiA family protein [Bacteroidota bacterium]
QNTGEDWKNVRLSLSNSNPVESGNKPVLNPWYLRQISYSPVRYENVYYKSAVAMVSGVISGKVTDGNDGSPLPGTTVAVEGSSVATVTDEQGNYSLNLPSGAQTLTFSFIGYETYKTPISSKIINASLLPQNLQLDEVVVVGYGVSKKKSKNVRGINAAATRETINQTNVQFDIELPYSIPADGKVYSADIKQMEIPADYEYYCAPKLDKDAFLTAKISNWEEYNLLDGEMNLYFEGTYVGKSVLDVRNVTDTLQISLGRDKNIVVTRTKQKEFSKSQFLGNNKTEMRAFTIAVRNKKQQPVNLILEDQFPISTDKDMTVKKTDYSGATIDEQTGKVTWKLTLKSSEEQKVNLGYSVEHPKNKPVVLE